MGQKTNPIIFRLNKTASNWESNYFEKKSTEGALTNYKDVEVRKFIYKFFTDNGLILHKLKLLYSGNRLDIFLSYFSTSKTSSTILLINKNQNIKIISKQTKTNDVDIQNQYKKIKKAAKKYVKYKELNYQGILEKNKITLNQKFQQTLVEKTRNSHFRRLKFLKYYKNYLTSKKYKNISNAETHSFLNKFFESLNKFINNKINISLTLNRLNQETKRNIQEKEINNLKKKLVTLRKYKDNEFFKEGVNIIFLSTIQKNSASLLAKFLATQLQKLRRHNFFLRFVKSALLLFFTNTNTKFKGIKIKVKGRFNRAPRARHKIIKIGNGVPALTINSNINYSESVAFTSNGTFGVKVWIDEKKYYVDWTKTNKVQKN